jgi:hypothetical protein
MTALKNAARMERMLLRDHTIYAAETITPLGLPQYFVSNQLIAGNCKSLLLITYMRVSSLIQLLIITRNG